jgi:uncharacterized protein YjbI with pentapeptide repeats
MKSIILVILVVASTVIWYGFEGKSVTAKKGSEISYDMLPTNFTGADLTGANLEGVSIGGVILCNTTMPDGTLNNTSCKN